MLINLQPDDLVIATKQFKKFSTFEGTHYLCLDKCYTVYSVNGDIITFTLNNELIGPFNIKDIYDKIHKIRYDSGNLLVI